MNVSKRDKNRKHKNIQYREKKNEVGIRVQWFWQKFWKLMCHIVLDKKKNSKNILEKVIFYILSGFFLNWDLCPKMIKMGPSESWFFILEIGHSRHKKKIENCMLVSKTIFAFVTKCSQKKLKIKKLFLKVQIWLSPNFSVF
jgi:hypothetical protein